MWTDKCAGAAAHAFVRIYLRSGEFLSLYRLIGADENAFVAANTLFSVVDRFSRISDNC